MKNEWPLSGWPIRIAASGIYRSNCLECLRPIFNLIIVHLIWNSFYQQLSNVHSTWASLEYVRDLYSIWMFIFMCVYTWHWMMPLCASAQLIDKNNLFDLHVNDDDNRFMQIYKQTIIRNKHSCSHQHAHIQTIHLPCIFVHFGILYATCIASLIAMVALFKEQVVESPQYEVSLSEILEIMMRLFVFCIRPFSCASA